MTAPATDIDLWLCPGPIQEYDLLLCPRGNTAPVGVDYNRATSIFIPLPEHYAERTQSVQQTASAGLDNIDHLAFPAIISFSRFASDEQPTIASACATETAFVRIAREVVPEQDVVADRALSYVREGLEVPSLEEDPFRQVSYARPLVEQTATEADPTRAAAISRDLFMGQGMAIEVARQTDYVRLYDEAVTEGAAALPSMASQRTSTDEVAEQQVSAQVRVDLVRMAAAQITDQAEVERTAALSRQALQALALTAVAVRVTNVSRSVDAALVLDALAARRVVFRRRPTEALAGSAEAATRVVSFARRPRFPEVAFRTSPAASRAVSYARLGLTEQDLQQAQALPSWATSRTAYDEQAVQDAAATQNLDLKRIARDLNLMAATASRVAHVSRRSNEYMAFVGSARRTVAYRRFTQDVVAEQGHQATRRATFPRRASDFVPLSAATERTYALSRSTREVLESLAVASRTAEMSRLGAEQIATEDTTSRSLTVIRLGAEEFGDLSDSATRSALVTRSATEITSTDLVVMRTTSVSRDLSLVIDVLATQFASRAYSRLVDDVVDAMVEQAIRERLYLTDRQRFPHPYDLDLATGRVYAIQTGRSRPMVLDLSSTVSVSLETGHDEVYVLETTSGLWAVLTTNTED